MNRTKKNILYNKNRQQIAKKKNDWSSDDLSAKMAYLCDSINNICQQPYVPLDEILKSSNSTLGKLFQLFLSLKDKKENLLNRNVFNDLIMRKTEGLLIKLNHSQDKYSMNFIQFIKQIEILAKGNQISKEYLYKKVI
jgi:hypothetical protein